MTHATDAALVEALAALASPTRLTLLRALRRPQIVSEIEVPSSDASAISRQAVKKHLDALLGAGLVATRDVVRERGDTVEFSLNHQAIYALAEEVRDLARLRPIVEPALSTIARGTPRIGGGTRFPALVVVKGLDEGTTFHLDAEGGRRSEWIIGRRRGLDIALDFDPFVSSENTRVVREGDAFSVETMPTSRNGTSVNFAPLAPGERRRLRHGDLVGVGRTTLAYWTSA